MAFDLLFVFGLFVAPVFIIASASGLLTLWAAAAYNDRHPALRRSLGVLLLVSSALALLLGFIVAFNNE